MLDIRDHGWIFGGGKYKKGSLIPTSNFSVQSPIITSLSPGDYRRAIGADDTYFYVCSQYNIFRFNIETKVLDSSWTISFSGEVNGYMPTYIIKDGGNYFVSFETGHVMKYSSSGTKIFKSGAFGAGYFSRLYIYNETLYYISNALVVYKVNKDTGVGTLTLNASVGSNYYEFYVVDNYVYCQIFDNGFYPIKKYNMDTGQVVYSLFNNESYSGASILDVEKDTETLLFLHGQYIIKRKNGSVETYKINLGTSEALGKMIYNKVTKKLYVFTLNTLRCVDTISGALLYTKVLYGSVYKNSGYLYPLTLPDGTSLGNFNVYYNGSGNSEMVSVLYEQLKLLK